MNRFGRAGSTFVTVIAAVIVLAIATTSGAVAGSLITSKKIKNNTIKSIDVRDGALKGVDVADGSLGKADLAAAARGYTSIVSRSVTQADVANGANSQRAVFCNAGEIAIGGGAYVTPGGALPLIGTTDGIVVKSHPVGRLTVGNVPFTVPSGNGAAPLGWRTEIQNDAGETENAVHYAICAAK